MPLQLVPATSKAAAAPSPAEQRLDAASALPKNACRSRCLLSCPRARLRARLKHSQRCRPAYPASNAWAHSAGSTRQQDVFRRQLASLVRVRSPPPPSHPPLLHAAACHSPSASGASWGRAPSCLQQQRGERAVRVAACLQEGEAHPCCRPGCPFCRVSMNASKGAGGRDVHMRPQSPPQHVPLAIAECHGADKAPAAPWPPGCRPRAPRTPPNPCWPPAAIMGRMPQIAHLLLRPTTARNQASLSWMRRKDRAVPERQELPAGLPGSKPSRAASNAWRHGKQIEPPDRPVPFVSCICCRFGIGHRRKGDSFHLQGQSATTLARASTAWPIELHPVS